jgi:hypothetical protein
LARQGAAIAMPVQSRNKGKGGTAKRRYLSSPPNVVGGPSDEKGQ